MKEIHAYLNDDGTYRVETDGCAMDNGELKEIILNIPRAKITVEPLIEIGSGEIYSVTVKESNTND